MYGRLGDSIQMNPIICKFLTDLIRRPLTHQLSGMQNAFHLMRKFSIGFRAYIEVSTVSDQRGGKSFTAVPLSSAPACRHFKVPFVDRP